MIVKQLSVFLENKEGRLCDAIETLSSNGINISALSLADSTEYGMLRMLVSDPESGVKVLKAAGIPAKLTDVICLKAAHKTGALSRILKAFMGKGIAIEYMYAFAAGENASVVMKTSDTEKAIEVIKESDIEAWEAETIYNINA
ncbi:hypothetical protein [Anaerobium acetethylicum]|uniref:Uncharacterized conserved protein, contains tandem ACT domains n=1 Tax=Anaerobium acetethylicum TaxID=1619234 RepID=A0A1D3TQF0_9FIRM|nr:hypothetical protein [Anaerobium acetethylicum]SCP95784.1 Uncharacterized conserved protein, contains tandem ACT domains [Anaerobium acetethylicum]